jgi:AraC-like DNA-binding protein
VKETAGLRVAWQSEEAMRYVSRPPMRPLVDFVDYFWALGDVPAHARERVVPTGTLELVVNVAEDEFRIYDRSEPERLRRFSGALVSGAYRRFFVIDTRAHASIIGVHFKPGGAFSILGGAPGALVDQHVDLEMLWPRREASELREQLCGARNVDERFAILESAVLARVARRRPRHDAVGVALDRLSRPGASVRAVTEEVQLSHRRLLELFTAEVGMTPKVFARVQRLQRALARIPTSSLDWTRLALDCGYFDQSHMIRDFVALSGSPPSQVIQCADEVKAHHFVIRDRSSDLSNTGRRSITTVKRNERLSRS